MQRQISDKIHDDIREKIVLLSGPRQVGKTTIAQTLTTKFTYLNYDAPEDRALIASREWDRHVDLVIFDELHKMKQWKSWIKGLYDTAGIPPGIVVTGSARLGTFRKGGDSLAGRHFHYRLHPFTVKELVGQVAPADTLDRLLRVGGFPEPFLKNSEATAKRWRSSHLDVILRQDLLDLEQVRDIKSIEIMIDLLRRRVGGSTSYAALAGDLQVSVHTVKHWLQILENLYVIFPVRPYHKNIARSLLKEAKYYFYDTGAVIGDDGARLENVVACALLAELDYLEDTTGSHCALQYLRDKEKHEVDFLVVIDDKPQQMIEVKWRDDHFSPHLPHFLRYFHKVSAVQVVHQLKRKKSTPVMTMMSAVDFLKSVAFGA